MFGIAKGIEFMRLKSQDPVQAQGPLMCESLVYIGFRNFDVLFPPHGFALHQNGTELNRLERVAAANFNKPDSNWNICRHLSSRWLSHGCPGATENGHSPSH